MSEDQLHPVAPENKPPTRETLTRKGMTIFFCVQCTVLVVAAVSLLDIGNYGWTLFGVIPFSIGITIGSFTLLYKSRKLLRGMLLTILAVAALSLVFVMAGLEGMICVLMAAGIIGLPALAGVAVGYWIRNIFRTHILIFLALLNSSFYTYDHFDPSEVRSTAVESVIVQASPDKIWYIITHGVRFHPNSNMFFEAGVNYPTSMQLTYAANNKCFLVCTLSTGNAALEIEKIDSVRLLRFRVPADIIPMKELTVYDTLNAPHLQGYFKPVTGEFEIEPVDETHCKLIARTSYTYKITPVFYWRWWSDYLVNTMHAHVLNDVKTLAEE